MFCFDRVVCVLVVSLECVLILIIKLVIWVKIVVEYFRLVFRFKIILFG